ncbi:MAG TPA: serine hydrolase domain-containing protein, partial [Gammaproteobacteria bacterium]|nr:serine hydrolase domain-containing protein [Gammaproteobacteria bacterium]
MQTLRVRARNKSVSAPLSALAVALVLVPSPRALAQAPAENPGPQPPPQMLPQRPEAAVPTASTPAPAIPAPARQPEIPSGNVASASPPAGGPRLAPSEPIPPAELEAFLDATIGVAMDQFHIAGAAVSVVQDGRLVLEKGYGFASLDPPRRVDPATTLFRIGSISKTFTWIEVMKAVEAGKMDLDAPINTYLPADLRIPDEGFERPIRLRDLLTHSPGFEDRVLGVLFVKDPNRLLTMHDALARYRPKRVREPGTISSYSNYGAVLAGAAVAEVEGAFWQDLIERDILGPLGLMHVTGREPYAPRADLPKPMPASLASDVSTGFHWNGAGFDGRGFEYISESAPAGAMSASAGDMARYMLLLLGDGTLDGVTVFGPEAARAFRTPMTSLP